MHGHGLEIEKTGHIFLLRCRASVQKKVVHGPQVGVSLMCVTSTD